MGKDVEKNKKEKKHFFKDFKAELKKVIWPTPKQIVNNTIAVITIVIITAIIVLVLDLAFEALNTYGINKIRGLVSSDNITVEEEHNHEHEDTSAEGETVEINNETGEGTIQIDVDANSVQENNTVQE